MPFRRSVRVEFVNAADRPTYLYFQIDYTLEPDLARRRATCTRCSGGRTRRGCAATSSSPTAERPWPVRRLRGRRPSARRRPVVRRGRGQGVPRRRHRPADDLRHRAGGLRGHRGAWACTRRCTGAPLEVRDPEGGLNPDFVGFYRWHVPDPIMFARDLRVTIQQIGYEVFRAGDEDRMAAKEPAGDGWHRGPPWRRDRHGTAERVDDYCVSPTSCVPSLSPYPGSTSPRQSSTSAAGTTRRVGHGVVRHGNAYPIGAAPRPAPGGDRAGRREARASGQPARRRPAGVVRWPFVRRASRAPPRRRGGDRRRACPGRGARWRAPARSSCRRTRRRPGTSSDRRGRSGRRPLADQCRLVVAARFGQARRPRTGRRRGPSSGGRRGQAAPGALDPLQSLGHLADRGDHLVGGRRRPAVPRRSPPPTVGPRRARHLSPGPGPR